MCLESKRATLRVSLRGGVPLADRVSLENALKCFPGALCLLGRENFQRVIFLPRKRLMSGFPANRGKKIAARYYRNFFVVITYQEMLTALVTAFN